MFTDTVPLASLVLSKANPRKLIKDIEGLAASIQQDGLLQNLVVEPSGKKGQYRIVSGERRYRALKLLNGRGALPIDYAVKVEIRRNLSKDDSLRIALPPSKLRLCSCRAHRGVAPRPGSRACAPEPLFQSLGPSG